MAAPDALELSAELDSQTLLEAAAQAGTPVSARMLETFRYKGLIPRSQRSGYRGQAPVWTYPPGSDAQLVRLHAPVGLAIGARTPTEVAVSIAAQLIEATVVARGSYVKSS